MTTSRHRFHQPPPRSLRRGAEGLPRDPEHQRAARSTRPTSARCAEWTAKELERIGMQNVRLIETPGQSRRVRRLAGRAGQADDPLLRPLRRAAGRPAGQLDVAAVRGDGARRRALRPRRRRRQGPGLHALQGHRGAPEAAGSLPCNIKVFIEGEEEVGSTHLDEFVRAHKARARMPTSSSSPIRRCSIAASRRFATACAAWRTSSSISRGTASDLHSGSFGGAVANPAIVLAQVLAQMKDRGGRIKIPGFYDDVRELTAEERAEWQQLPFNENEVPEGPRRAKAVRRDRLHDARARLGAADLRGERAAVRLHRRRREDRDSCRRDGQGQHAPRARSGSRKDRRPVRGLPEEDHPEDGRSANSRACTAASRG